MFGNSETQFFYNLTPEIILDSIETLGFQCTGYCYPLNSMENRVYQIGIEPNSHSENFINKDIYLIAKFYRPGRWTYEQIKEEHDFLQELKESEIPAVPAIKFDGETIFKAKNSEIYFSLFPKCAGRSLDEITEKQAIRIGTQLAYLHNVGAKKKAEHRLKLDVATYGKNNIEFLEKSKMIPAMFEEKYLYHANEIINKISPMFEKAYTQRIHGDFHFGNLLWTNSRDDQILFIDFDDMVTGPPVQDIWLIIPGNDEEATKLRSKLIESYDVMRAFDYNSIKLIEPLRTLRYIHYATWIAKRWEDPFFKKAFPYFTEPKFWQEKTIDLIEQSEKIFT